MGIIGLKKYLLLLVVGFLAFIGIVINVYGNLNDSVIYYDGRVLRVIYEPRLISSKTMLELSLKGASDKLMAVRVYGVSTGGFYLVGGADGRGSVSLDITGYVNDVYNYTQTLGWDPDRAGPSLLALILVAEENKPQRLLNITTQAISIPIVPGMAKGSTVKVEVEYRPITLKSVKLKPGVEVKEPPNRVGEICTYYPGPGGGYECYYWELNQTLYQSAQGVPVLAVSLGDSDGQLVYQVINSIKIDLIEANAPYFSVNMGFAIGIRGTGSGTLSQLSIPGPGFTVYREYDATKDRLFDLDCIFINQYLADLNSGCEYFNDSLGDIPEFYGDSVVFTGFVGDFALAEYVFVREECYSYGCDVEVMDNISVAAWMAPVADPDTEKIYPWYFVDDYPGDGVGFDEIINIISDSIDPTYYQTINNNIVSIYADDIIVNAQSTPRLGLAVPLGALIAFTWNPPAGLAATLSMLVVSFEYGVTHVGYYNTLSGAIIYTSDPVTFNVEYYKVDRYRVESEGAEYPAPMLIIMPNAS